MGNSAKTITATPRQLESLIRISESLAKMRLSNKVEQRDIEEGVRLIRTAMQQSATDPKTGEIDLDIITTGVSFASNARVKVICDYIKKVQVSYSQKLLSIFRCNFDKILTLIFTYSSYRRTSERKWRRMELNTRTCMTTYCPRRLKATSVNRRKLKRLSSETL